MTDKPKVRTETRERTLVVEIDRPEVRNAVDAETARLLHESFQVFEDDDSLHVAILTGSEGHFCSGADLHALADEVRDRVTVDGPGSMGPTRMRLSKPVIAAIEGYAVAGGIELALWCDLRVAAEGATLGVFCRRLGVPLVDGGTIRLPRLIGQSRALDLILTGRGVGAEEALEMGLVNRVAPNGGALAAALELAAEIGAHPQACMRNDRMSALEQWTMGEGDALVNETRHGLATIGSGETMIGASRFRAGEGRHGEVV
ncbi:MAG: crotonase/enoyl-CoA hydratase family protein [Acidimicrobiia bacterium]